MSRYDDRGYDDRGHGGDRDRGYPPDHRSDRDRSDRDRGDRDRGYDRGAYGGGGDRGAYGGGGDRGAYGGGYDRDRGDRDRGYDRGRAPDRSGYDRGSDRDRGYERDRDYSRGRDYNRSRDYTRPPPPPPAPSRRLYLGNLSSEVKNSDVEAEFSRHGRVSSVSVFPDATNPFGFVEFAESRDAETAMRELDGRTFMGKTLRVEASKPPKRGEGEGYKSGPGNSATAGTQKRTDFRLLASGLHVDVGWQTLKDFARDVRCVCVCVLLPVPRPSAPHPPLILFFFAGGPRALHSCKDGGPGAGGHY